MWIELSSRSTWGIYQFFGTLADAAVRMNGPPIRLIQPGYADNRDELILFDLKKAVGPAGCFVHVEMEDRATYCVPNGPSSRMTRAAFVVLQVLTAMLQSTTSGAK